MRHATIVLHEGELGRDLRRDKRIHGTDALREKLCDLRLAEVFCVTDVRREPRVDVGHAHARLLAAERARELVHHQGATALIS